MKNNNEICFVINCVINNFNMLMLNLKQIERLYPNSNVQILVDLYEFVNKDLIEDYFDLKNFISLLNLNINIDKINMNIEYYFPNPKERCLFDFIKHTTYKYLIILDDDTFLLNCGLIEKGIELLKNHSEIPVIGEILRPYFFGMKTSIPDVSPRPERLANWFMILNVNVLRKHNLNIHCETKEEMISYLEQDYKLCKKRNLTYVRDDLGYLYFKLNEKKLKIVNLYDYIYFYNEYDNVKHGNIPIELLKSDGNASTNYYYIHAGGINNDRKRCVYNYLLNNTLFDKLICYDDLDQIKI